VRYFHSDHLGSSNIVTNETGERIAHTEFTPYGSISVQDGSYDPKYKFTGKERDETGLYFYGARYYDPELGRFISADTIVQNPGDPQSLNRYSYCRNNPLNLVDPTGHSFWQTIRKLFSDTGVPSAVVNAFVPNSWEQYGRMMAIAAASMFASFAAAAFAATFVAPAMASFFSAGGTTAITATQNAIITGTEFGLSGFAGGFAGTLAGGGSLGDAFQAGGIGFGIGAVTGGLAGYSYAKGWQSVIHGYDVRAVNQDIFINQIGSGNYPGANQTLRTDAVLRMKLLGDSAGEGLVETMRQSGAGVYLRGTNAEGYAYIKATRQLDGTRWVTKPYAIDPITGKSAIMLNPSEFRAFTGTPGFGRGEYFALAVAPDKAVSFEGVTTGGAPQWIIYGEHAVIPGSPFKNPN
jgi:RHS repeat-associated protein